MVKQLYDGINYWIELNYQSNFESDLDIHCFELDENENFIDHIFWRINGGNTSKFTLITNNGDNHINNEKLFLKRFNENHSYIFVIEDFLFNIIQYSSSMADDYPILLSIFLKERYFKISSQHIRYKQNNRSHWMACAIYKNEVFEINRFINENELLEKFYNNSFKISEIINIYNLKPLKIYS